MTLIDLFREFSLIAQSKRYPTSARMLYYTLLHVWNDSRRPEVTSRTRQELYTLAGLPSATFSDAVSFLSNERWIKRVNGRNRTNFEWIMLDVRTNSERKAGTNVPARAETETESW